MLQRNMKETALNFNIPKIIYNDSNRWMVSFWRTDSYYYNKLIQIGDIEIMNSVYGSS